MQLRLRRRAVGLQRMTERLGMGTRAPRWLLEGCSKPTSPVTFFGFACLTPIHFVWTVDFTNPNDPNDKSFEIDGTEYPWAELEFPNSHASERCV